MGRNAQRRRNAKGAARLKARGLRPASKPDPYIRLLGRDGYLVTHYGLTIKQAREALLGGKVNVNGSVWSYPDVQKREIERDQLGRLRIMVEGVPDTRPPIARSL